MCQEPIDGSQEYIGFPHFIEDERDHFWRYSDAAFHKWCFDAWPGKNEFLKRLRAFEKSAKSR
jgi:hypothetical protein